MCGPAQDGPVSALAREEGWELHPHPHSCCLPLPSPTPPMAGSQRRHRKRHSSGETAVDFSESLRTGDQRTQTGRGKIQDSLERKEKLKEPEYIYNSNKNDEII